MTIGGTVKKYSASLLAVPLAASMLLAGCSGDSKADAHPPGTIVRSPTTTGPATTTSAAPTTAAPKTDPNIPAAARAHTSDGAKAFVRYFFERLNVAWTTPRTGILSPLCQPAVESCAAYEKTATELTKAGHRLDGNPLTVKSVQTLDATNPNKYDVLAQVVQEPVREIDGAGKTHGTERHRNLRVDFELLYTDQAWSAMSIDKVK
jgi:Family of unknown function (DUF6318)